MLFDLHWQTLTSYTKHQHRHHRHHRHHGQPSWLATRWSRSIGRGRGRTEKKQPTSTKGHSPRASITLTIAIYNDRMWLVCVAEGEVRAGLSELR